MSYSAALKQGWRFMLRSDSFGVEVWRLPHGREANKWEQHQAVAHHGQLEGTREVAGDGRVLNVRDGNTTRESLILEVDKTVEVNHARGHSGGVDIWRLQDVEDGEDTFWHVKRVIGRGRHSKSLLLTRTDWHTRRKLSRDG